MEWLDGAISALQSLSHLLDQVKHLAILAFMISVQALIVVAFVVWAAGKFWSLARTLIVVNGIRSDKSDRPPPVVDSS